MPEIPLAVAAYVGRSKANSKRLQGICGQLVSTLLCQQSHNLAYGPAIFSQKKHLLEKKEHYENMQFSSAVHQHYCKF